MRKVETFIPASSDLQRRWSELRAAINAAAAPHTGMTVFALAPYRLLELPGAQAEMQGVISTHCKGGKVDSVDVAGNRCHTIERSGRIGFLVVEWQRDSANRPGAPA
jgi:hypothetical protein